MGHLVKSVRDESMAKCYHAVKEARDYLAQQGARAINLASHTAGSPVWGSKVKRLQVSLPQDARPILIDVDIKESEHNLAEVVNQCATMERLLDTLVWAQTDESGFAQFRVEAAIQRRAVHEAITISFWWIQAVGMPVLRSLTLLAIRMVMVKRRRI